MASILNFIQGDHIFSGYIFHVWSGNKSNVKRHIELSLHEALWQGKTWRARQLIEGGSNINAIDKEKVTPLHIASLCGNTGTIRLLLKKGANSRAEDCRKQDPFYWAAYNGQVKKIQILKRHDPNYDINKKDHRGKTAIRAAAKNGHIEVIDELMGHGAALDVKDERRGWTPMHIAAFHGRFLACEKLKE